MVDQPMTAARAAPQNADPRPVLVVIFAILTVIAFFACAEAFFYRLDIFAPFRAMGSAVGGLLTANWSAALDFIAWLLVLFPVAIALRTWSWFANEGKQSFAGNVFNDGTLRNFFFEMLLLAALGFVFWFIVGNAVFNLARAGIATGFDFLARPAGFQINQSAFIPYNESSSYGMVFWVGLQNTLLVAVIGIVLATILGFIVGVARLSTNWIVSRVAYAYVEIMRNIPLLLWIFIWYFGVLRLLPDKGNPLDLGPLGLLNIAGYYAPLAVFGPGAGWALWAFGAAIAISIAISSWSRRRQMATGQTFPVFWTSLALIVLLPLFALAAARFPVTFEMPTASRFGPRGGMRIFPEYMALLVALVTYTSAYIGEIVRAGILAIHKGQTEASYALGLRPGSTLRLVVVPQALRVIIPPMTNQYLNLTKNSSLAVAIAYPDLVSTFAGTALNQTGQAVEILLITMLTYLTLSLVTSLFMNWYNSRIALVER